MASPSPARSSQQPNQSAAGNGEFEIWLDHLCHEALIFTSGVGAAAALRDGDRLVCRASAGLAPEVGTPVDLSSGLCARAYNTNAMVVEQALEGADIRSIVAVPIPSTDSQDTAAQGFFALFSDCAGAFSSRHLQRANEIAKEIAERLGAQKPVAEPPSLKAVSPSAIPSSTAPDGAVELMRLVDADVSGESIPSAAEGSTADLTDDILELLTAGKLSEDSVAEPLATSAELKPAEEANEGPALPVANAPRPLQSKPGLGEPPTPMLTEELDALLASLNERFANKPTADAEVGQQYADDSVAEVVPLAELPTPLREFLDESERLRDEETAYTIPSFTPPTEAVPSRRWMVYAAIALVLLAVVVGVVVSRDGGSEQAQSAQVATSASPNGDGASVPASPSADAQPSATRPESSSRKASSSDTATSRKASAREEAPEEPALTVEPGSRPRLTQETVPEAVAPPAITIVSTPMPAVQPTSRAMPNLVAPRVAIDPPRLITKVNPVLPQVARSMRMSGSVQLAVVVAPDGTVRRTRVLQGKNSMLDSAAEDAVRRWRYSALPEGSPDVDREVTITIKFQP